METMLPEAETYTYTARSARNPNQVATLTLIDHKLRIDIPEVLDTIGEVATADEKLAEAGEQLKSQMQPAVMKAVEAMTGPIELGDASAQLRGQSLIVTAWKRLGGLRLARMNLRVSDVDNPDAAEAFVDEFEQRQATADDRRKFAGPLDYWWGWMGLMLGLVVLLKWPRLRRAAA